MNMLIYQWYEIVWWIIPMFAKPIREFCGDILPQLKGKQQNIHVILVICWWNIRHSPQKTTSRTRCSATEETEPEACDYCAQSFTKCHGNMLSIVGAWECIPVSKWFVSHEYSSYIVIFPHYSWHILRLLLVSGARTSNWSKSLSRSLLIIFVSTFVGAIPMSSLQIQVFTFVHSTWRIIPRKRKRWRSPRFLGCKLTPLTNWSSKQEPQSLGWPVLVLAGRVGHKPAPWPTPACAWRCRTRTMPGSLPCGLTASALQSSTKGAMGFTHQPRGHYDFYGYMISTLNKKNVIVI